MQGESNDDGIMKNALSAAVLVLLAAMVSCTEFVNEVPEPYFVDRGLTVSKVARIISELPLGSEHLNEVYDAVNSSSVNGYDEEYTMSELFSSPGSGVGEESTRSDKYSRPMRDLFADYFRLSSETRSGGDQDVEELMNSLMESDMQIYWPYSEYWDGRTFPIVTFDPGYGAESNYGYVIRSGPDGRPEVADSVIVDEKMAMERPVWVINTNDDRNYTPITKAPQPLVKSSSFSSSGDGSEYSGKQKLCLKSFMMLRNYDSWFAGASEFWVKIGAVDGFKAADENDLKLYTPTVTDFMVVIKRNQLGVRVPLDVIMLTDFTDQIEKLAFLVIEDDGGESTSWKASAVVKVNSKQYGFDVTIPYRDHDDVVWRGQLSTDYFYPTVPTEGRFGDVKLVFELH